MGGYIAKQPNGKYCRFSTVVDCVTHTNMTRDDYIEMCKERAEREAVDVLDNHLQDFDRIIEDTAYENIKKHEFHEWLNRVGYKPICNRCHGNGYIEKEKDGREHEVTCPNCKGECEQDECAL